jgi:hypothetical protein
MLTLPAFLQGVLAAAALGLVVEGVVLLYQLVSASDSRMYAKVLRDQYGAWVERLTGVGPVEWHERGPFQFVRLRPRGRLLPLSKPDLMRAFEDQTSGWFRRTLDMLRTEAALEEAGLHSPSPLIRQFREQLERPQSFTQPPQSESGPSSIENGREEIRRFFVLWDGANVPLGVLGDRKVPARVLLSAFRLTFFPNLTAIDTHFEKMMRTYSLERYRRNVRQRLMIACLVVGFFDVLRAGPAVAQLDAATAVASYAAFVILATLVATWASRALTSAADGGEDASKS